MLKNYLRIAIRNLLKQKVFSFINIAGLAIGMACCILIFLYVQDELKFDQYHANKHRVYRLINQATREGETSAIQPAIMLPYLRSDFPEIEKAIRIIDYADCLISSGDKHLVDGKFIFADPEIFAIFSFPFVAGNPQEALLSPFSLVLTESAAARHFGDQNPSGATLRMDNQYDFTVTGVIKDFPYHSHFRCNFLVSFSSYNNINSYMLEHWEASGTYQYVLLPEHHDKETLEAKFPAFLEKHRGREFAAAVKLQLEPLTDIHLHSGKTRWDRTDLNLRFRQLLVVLQFSVSIALMSCTLLIQQQLNFIRNAKLGFDKENTVIITNPWNDKIGQRYEQFKNAVSQNPQIRMVSAADDVPPGNINNYTRARAIQQSENEAKHFGLVAVDYDYLPAIGAEFVAGRNFSREHATDENNTVIVNESAVAALNLDSPIGVQLTGIDNTSGPQTIIGVVKDMHYRSLHETVEPAIFYVKPWNHGNIVVNLGAGNPTSTLSYLQNQWGKIAPEWPFQYYFMDQEVDRLYRAEQRMATVIRLFTLLAVFVSALGLFGLITLATATRTKEIGIRKVLGATVANVVNLLSRDFVKLVLIANLIAAPIAYFAMNKWLQSFAYRIEIGWMVFVFAGGIALVIALLTVSTQAIKAALANPVESLRYE